MFAPFFDSIFSVLFPQPCHICGGSVDRYADGVACGECWSATRIFKPDAARCGKCGFFLESHTNEYGASDCGRCYKMDFDKARAVGLYEKALAATVLEMKVTPHLPASAARHLTGTFANADFGNVDVMIPVPLSKRRYIERGFNQAALIAEDLGKRLKINVDSRSLTRPVHTPRHRAGMDSKAREMSVHNAFDVVRPKLVEGRSVLLIDDVLTSGSTASACARILKKKGASAVNVLTIARAS